MHRGIRRRILHFHNRSKLRIAIDGLLGAAKLGKYGPDTICNRQNGQAKRHCLYGGATYRLWLSLPTENIDKRCSVKNKRDLAIEIVHRIQHGGYETEQEDEEMLAELHGILPDPEFERFLFWGPEGPEDPRYTTMTAEDVVDEAFSYQPTEL